MFVCACIYILYTISATQRVSSIGKIWIFKRFDLGLGLKQCYRRESEKEQVNKEEATSEIKYHQRKKVPENTPATHFEQ